MDKITKITVEEIKDSRGNPTIRVAVFCGDKTGSFSVPAGVSTGTREASCQSAGRAIEKIKNIITPALIGKNILNQKEIDELMIKLDGTPNKNNLGSNSMVGVSIACAKIAAEISGQETFEYLRTLAEIKPSRRIPYLYMNLINGGKHADNNLAFQEYLIVPETENVEEAIGIGIAIQNTLKEKIKKDLGEESVKLGDEGGLAPKISDIRQPILYLREAIKQNGLEGKVKIALDAAGSSFYQAGRYQVGEKSTTKEELLDIYIGLIKEFNLFSIEDPFAEEDFESFNSLKEKNQDLLVVGDDLTVTNVALLKKAIAEKSINAMIVKPNQVGTLTETLNAMKLARENGLELIVSHRSGETNDDFIADLAYAFNCFGFKSGAPGKPERMVKYKRLKKIANL